MLEYIAKLGKPMFVSTGASTLDEVRMAYETVMKHNNKLCLLHCIAGYPTEYHDLNLKTIKVFKKEFPEAIIGYSGHDNGILAGVIAYMLGAVVLEKHFTLNRAWKGTDHKFSLEPEGLRKQVRDLRRVDISLGDGKRVINDFESEPRKKMGKGVYASRSLTAGQILAWDDISLKTPTNGTPPYKVQEMLGKKLRVDIEEESPISLDMLA
jgi:N-acetylneuraminate synthase/sialic acid synthase